ncbi:MAG: FAD-dependent thymidylate synthase [Brevinemataceae bacterium]
MKVELLFVSPDAEKICESSARECYDSHDKMTEISRERMLPALLKAGHLSIFEHGAASFRISGISRALSHQLVRHRLSSFSQRSQRYVNEAEFEYVVPPAVSENAEAESIYRQTMEYLCNQYSKLIELGIKKEDARFLLPNASETKLVMTANFRQWLHVIDMRVSRGAQWEIRELLTTIWKELYKHAPNVFSDQYFEFWSKDPEFKKQIFETRIK